jgi:phage shock protein PspC (stress-responsive transcriptional regulator)
MHQVLTMNLNGRAYLFDEPAFAALRAYLEQAHQQLQGNADHADILADFEQAIAEKCALYLRAHKNVVTAAEVDDILRVMGPVETDDGAALGAATSSANTRTGETIDLPAKRLYRVYEGAMISGICNGIAAYFGIDVTLVRVIFVVLSFLTSGFGLLCYLVLFFVIPSAKTAQERAAARGMQFNAQALIQRAKAYYANLQTQSDWRRRWARQQRFWRDRWSRGRAAYAPAWAASSGIVATPPGDGLQWRAVFGIPLIALLNTALAIGALVLILLLASNAAWLSPAYPTGLQLGVTLAVVAVIYSLLAWPLNQFRRELIAALEPAAAWWAGLSDIVLRLALLAAAAILAYESLPDLREWVDSIPWNWTFKVGVPRT